MGQIWDAMNSTGPHHRVAANIERTTQATEQMNQQMAGLLQLNAQQLAVQRTQLAVQAEQLYVQRDQLAVQQESLYVQDQIRALSQQHLAVSQEQLVQGMKAVQRLDVSNQTLARIDASLVDISGVLAQQNALLQKSLNRLANEAQELITRGLDALNNGWFTDAARDFATAVEKDPYSAPAYYFLGKCHTQLKSAPEARQAYDKCMHYARRSAPMLHCLALCDLAALALKDNQAGEARRLLSQAQACPEQEKTVLVSMLLETDLATGAVSPGTTQAIQGAFADEAVDPEVLLEVLSLKAKGAGARAPAALQEEMKAWRQAENKALFERLISHFYRELEDYVYLAPRIRRGFMEAAQGKFLSLGDPLADLLDWTAMIGEELLKSIEHFPPETPAILRLHGPLGVWNGLLVQLNKLTALLAAKADLVGGEFVGQLNLGLLELPRMYEDDRILFEITTEEGDTLALSCYYAIFTRNGVHHFPVPLQDFSQLRLETYQAKVGAKGVLVVDPRHGQTLIQGTTGAFLLEGSPDPVYLIDLFKEAAGLLQEIHACLQWSIAHEEELFSIFLLLHAVAEKMTAQRRGLTAGPKKALPAPQPAQVQAAPAKPALPAPAAASVDDGFEVVADAPTSAVDDGFEVVEESPPERWFLGRNRQKHGPYTWPDLQKMATQGQVQPTDMLLREGSPQWSQASALPGLFPTTPARTT